MHRSPGRQIGLICAWSSAKIAKGVTAPNGGFALVLTGVSYRLSLRCRLASRGGTQRGLDWPRSDRAYVQKTWWWLVFGL